MRFVPAARELPDALRLSGLQVSAELGGRSSRYTPPVGRISRLAAHPANGAAGGTHVAPEKKTLSQQRPLEVSGAMSSPNPNGPRVATPAHRRLTALTGTFAAQVRIWHRGEEPMVGTGVITNTLELGGLFLRQIYRADPSDSPFGDFEGRGYWGWNPLQESYELFWIDNASPAMQLQRGNWEEEERQWVFRSPAGADSEGRPRYRITQVILQDSDHYLHKTVLRESDGSERPLLEIRFRRKAGR